MSRHLKVAGRTGVPIETLPVSTGERMEIGATDTPGGPRVYLRMGDRMVYLTPERAEEYAVDLRTFAIECRNNTPESA